MKIKLPSGKTNGNLNIYVPDAKEQKRLQEIWDDTESNAIRDEQTKYFANIKDPVDGCVNINYRN